MQVSEVHKAVREVLSAWEILRDVGFPADNIWVTFAPTVAVLASYNGKEFVISVGKVAGSPSVVRDLEDNYRKAGEAWNNGALDGLTIIRNAAITKHFILNYESFIQGLRDKGFEVKNGKVVLEEERTN